jgi:hypothetical protein
MTIARLALAAACLFIGIGGALADDAVCEGLAWNLDHERALLAAATPAGGVAFDRDGDAAVILTLVPFDAAKLAPPPERSPKRPHSYAGTADFKAAAKAGDYRISLAEAAWVDVVQDGRILRSAGFTGSDNCPGIHKSVRFHLGPSAFTVRISDAISSSIAIAITRAD